MRIYISLDCNPACIKRARYAFRALFDTLGFPYTFADPDKLNKTAGGVLIQYGGLADSAKPGLKKLTRILISEDWVDDTKRIRVGFLSTPEGRKLPVLGGKANQAYQIVSDSADDSILVEGDLIFSSFFFLSRLEEVVTGTADKHGRFPTNQTISHKHQLCQQAVVNQYLKLLYQIISKKARNKGIPLIRKCFWPGGQKLAVCLTHDVDIVQRWYLYSLIRCAELIKTGQVASSLRTFGSLLKGLLSGRNPALAFEHLTSPETRLSLKSSFYFMMGMPKLKALLSSDITYDLTKPEILEKAKELLRDDFEVGLHASYRTFLNRDLLLEEKEKLEELIGAPIQGLRQHFLRFRIPESWIDQQNCGFQYDTSLGFADQSGYSHSPGPHQFR